MSSRSRLTPTAASTQNEEEDLLIEFYNEGTLPRPSSHFIEVEALDYERRLAEEYAKVWGEASNTLLNRRLVDADKCKVDNKTIWHAMWITENTAWCVSLSNVGLCPADEADSRSWNRKEYIAQREHELARRWLADIPEEKWGSRILFPDAPYVPVIPSRRLKAYYRGQWVGRSRLSRCIYTAPPQTTPTPPPSPGATEPRTFVNQSTSELTAKSSPSKAADAVRHPCDFDGQVKAPLEETPKKDVAKKSGRIALLTPRRNTTSYERGDWQDPEPLMWEMVSAMPLPL